MITFVTGKHQNNIMTVENAFVVALAADVSSIPLLTGQIALRVPDNLLEGIGAEDGKVYELIGTQFNTSTDGGGNITITSIVTTNPVQQRFVVAKDELFRIAFALELQMPKLEVWRHQDPIILTIGQEHHQWANIVEWVWIKPWTKFLLDTLAATDGTDNTKVTTLETRVAQYKREFETVGLDTFYYEAPRAEWNVANTFNGHDVRATTAAYGRATTSKGTVSYGTYIDPDDDSTKDRFAEHWAIWTAVHTA